MHSPSSRVSKVNLDLSRFYPPSIEEYYGGAGMIAAMARFGNAHPRGSVPQYLRPQQRHSD